MSNKLNLITDANELSKEGQLIVKQTGKSGTVAKRIQRFLLSEIQHIEKHRNPTRLNVFLEGMRGGAVRVAAIRSYILAFANLEEETKVNGKGRTTKTGKLVMRKSRPEQTFSEVFSMACKTDWLSFKPESEPTVYDREAFEKDVIKLLSKAMSEGFTDKDIADVIGKTAATAKQEAKKVLAKKAGKEASEKVLASA